MASGEPRAANTRRAYDSDFAHFRAWCQTNATPPLPASTEAVYQYLMDLVADANSAGYAIATVQRRLAAIGAVHRSHGYDPAPSQQPQVRRLMAAIRRTYGRPANGRDPLTTAQLRTIVDHLDVTTPSGLRDRALLLLGFASELRRCDLASLTVEQLKKETGGYVVTLGDRPPVAVPPAEERCLCPVAAVDQWLAEAGIASGPVFRKVTRYQTVASRPLTAAAVALVVKRAAEAADLPPERLAAHSLRAGHRAATASPRAMP